MSEIRTFIAIEIPDTVHKKIAEVQDKLRRERERISWTKPGNIHLTLKFLGKVEEEKIAPIGQALQKTLSDIKTFDFLVKGLGVFPNFKRPRVLWAGIENSGNELIELAKKIEDELIHFGFSKENRTFTPHLTFGRVKSPLSSKFIEKLKSTEFEGDKVSVKEIVIMKSDLKPTGAVYTLLKNIKLS